MSESKRLTQADLERGLRDLGLGPGDHVLVHSALSSLGHVEGGAEAVIDALLAVVGAEVGAATGGGAATAGGTVTAGTVLMPTFGGRADPAVFLTDNPAVRDGVTQRARLFAHRLGQEAFTLAATSHFLGRHVEAMAEQAARFGVRHVELTFVAGQRVADLSLEALGELLRQLERAGLAASAVRDDRADPQLAETLLLRCAEAGLRRVIVPFDPGRRLGEAARECGVTVVLMNVNTPSRVIEGHLEAWKDLPVRLAFHPANFAACGESPFGRVYSRTRLKRITDQYYLLDGTFEGGRTAISRGNAEVRELLSITACAGFGGYWVLDGARPSRFPAAARRLFTILDREI